MDSCDLVLSAIKLSKYDAAKKLCEIFLITDKNKFAFLYGFVNIALKNYHIARATCASDSFKFGLVNALGDQNWNGLSVETMDSEEIIRNTQYEIKNDSVLLQKIFSGNLSQVFEPKHLSFISSNS